MSQYCLPDDIYPVVSQEKLKAMLGVSGAGGGNILTDTLTSFIILASNEIESTLAGLYVMPLDATTPQSLIIVKSICILLAVGYIYSLNTDNKLPDAVGKMIDNAREMLQSYGAGGIGMGRMFIPRALPDAKTQGNIAVAYPAADYPTVENIILGTTGDPQYLNIP